MTAAAPTQTTAPDSAAPRSASTRSAAPDSDVSRALAAQPAGTRTGPGTGRDSAPLQPGPRIAIEDVSLSIDGGLFAAKAVAGQWLPVEADIFTDGHDQLAAIVQPLRVQADGSTVALADVPLERGTNDRWSARITFESIGAHAVQIVAWVDLFATWRLEVAKKHAAGQPIALELREGHDLLGLLCAAPGPTADAEAARAELRALRATVGDDADALALHDVLMAPATAQLAARTGHRAHASTLPAALPVWVDRLRGAFGAWYELMPRSQSGDVTRHGTFDDVIARLPYVRDLGFDVLYFPPIHPIGTTHRKGRNNSLSAKPDDPGSPYAIGAPEGGHDAVHPQLGTLDDFARLVAACREHGLEIALDFAVQCSPDHPWIRSHPDFFQWRPDGSIRHAENPPKKYEDIVNVDFYGAGAAALWTALRDVVMFWADRGVRIFRVDNPHTKPLPFWQWLIASVRGRHPDTVFLSEAFTRPKMMRRLAKVGFTQSYTYFTWRNAKHELQQYLVELSTGSTPVVMRPNFFVNTPDINPYFLQTGGRAAHRIRLFLAATLSPSYGIYSGFELCEATPVPGKEEYLDSEKYEIRAWDWDSPQNIRADIALLNGLRRRFAVMQRIDGLAFYNAWNDDVLYYGRRSPDRREFLLFAVTLNPFEPREADFEVPLWELGLADDATVDAEDLVTGRHFQWHGKIHRMRLTPDERPYMAWRLIARDA